MSFFAVADPFGCSAPRSLHHVGSFYGGGISFASNTAAQGSGSKDMVTVSPEKDEYQCVVACVQCTGVVILRLYLIECKR